MTPPLRYRVVPGVAGIAADLLETQQRGLVFACILGLLVANGIWNVWELARASVG